MIDYYEDLCPFCEKNLLLTYICNDCNSVFCEDCLKEAVREELICSDCGKSEIGKNSENRFSCKSCKSENIIAVQRRINICPNCSGTNVSLLHEKMENLKERFKTVILSTRKYIDPLAEKVQIISNLRYKLIYLREDTIKINHFPQLEIELLQLIKLFDNIKESVQKKTAEFFNEINRDMKYFVWIEKQPPKTLSIISAIADALENHTNENLEFISNSLNRIEERISSINTKLNFMGAIQYLFLKYLPLLQLEVDEKPVFGIKCKLETGESEQNSIIDTKSETTEYSSKSGMVLLSDKKIHFIHEKKLFKKQPNLLFSLILDELQNVHEEGTIGKKLVLIFKNGIYKFRLNKEKRAQFKDFIEMARVFERNVIDPDSLFTLKTVDVSIDKFIDSLEEAIYTLIGLDGKKLNMKDEDYSTSLSNPSQNLVITDHYSNQANSDNIRYNRLMHNRFDNHNDPTSRLKNNGQFHNRDKFIRDNCEEDNFQRDNLYNPGYLKDYRSDFRRDVEINNDRYDSKKIDYGRTNFGPNNYSNLTKNQQHLNYLYEMYKKRPMLTRPELERTQNSSNDYMFQEFPYNGVYYNNEDGYDNEIYEGLNNHSRYNVDEQTLREGFDNRRNIYDWSERDNEYNRNKWNGRSSRSDGFDPNDEFFILDDHNQVDNYKRDNDYRVKDNFTPDRALFAAKRDRRKFGKHNDRRNENLPNNLELKINNRSYGQIKNPRTSKLGNAVYGIPNNYTMDKNEKYIHNNSSYQNIEDQGYSSQNLHDTFKTIGDLKTTFNERKTAQDSFRILESANSDLLNSVHMNNAIKKNLLGKEIRNSIHAEHGDNSKNLMPQRQNNGFEFNKYPRRSVVNGLKSIFPDDNSLNPNIPKPPPEFYRQNEVRPVNTRNINRNNTYAEKLLDLQRKEHSLKSTIEMLTLKHDRKEISNDYYFKMLQSLHEELYPIENEITQISKKI